MTLVVPAAPAAPTAVAADGLIVLSWEPPEFNPTENRAVVGYILTPYIGTEAQTPISFDVDVSMPVFLDQDGDGNDLVNGTTYTFRIQAVSSVGLGLKSPHSVAVTPNPNADISLIAEPWDYATTRLQFMVTEKLRQDFATSTLDGDTPRIAIVRSGYGSPVTPNDGVRLLDITAQEALALPYHTDLNGAPGGSSWVRPYSSEVSLYDRNLQPGRWYYYTLFMKAQSVWKAYGSAQALVPIDYQHRDHLWANIPEFYRVKDEELLVDPEGEGDLKNFINIIGFELDYTRTLAEGVQDTYQVERANSTLVQMLGETNLGTIKEEGLGEIRYRALVAVLTRLYNERGTEQGIKHLASIASKFRTKVTEGINLMRESDDAELNPGFTEPAPVDGLHTRTALGNVWQPLGTGSWATPYLSLIQVLAPSTIVEPGPGSDPTTGALYRMSRTEPFLGGMSYNDIRGNLSPDTYHATWPSPSEWPHSPDPKKVGGKVSINSTGGVVFCCGAGVARTGDRYHNLVPRLTLPDRHGIRCTSGSYYDWTIYAERIEHGHPGRVGIGIMWFGAQKGINATDILEHPVVNDDAGLTLSLPGFKPQHQELVTPSFTSLNYLSRDERLWTRDPEDPLIDSYPFPITVDPQTDAYGVVHDPTVNRSNPKRYTMRAQAPLSAGPEGFVYAVPYVAFSDSTDDRYIGCAMFSEESNPRDRYTVIRRINPATDDVSYGTPDE